ncbi:hypothetical protein OG195_01995 [Streptomyces sp. NBC_01362]|nr:hypothetical protein [Streptomyces sp. NBC_01362]
MTGEQRNLVDEPTHSSERAELAAPLDDDEAPARAVVCAQVPLAAEAEPVSRVRQQVGEECPSGEEVDACTPGVMYESQSCTACWDGSSPVKSDARAGEQTGEVQKKRLK